jgi:hypothetical protein
MPLAAAALRVRNCNIQQHYLGSLGSKAPIMTRTHALELFLSLASLALLTDGIVAAQTADTPSVAIKATFGLQPNLVTNT